MIMGSRSTGTHIAAPRPVTVTRHWLGSIEANFEGIAHNARFSISGKKGMFSWSKCGYTVQIESLHGNVKTDYLGETTTRVGVFTGTAHEVALRTHGFVDRIARTYSQLGNITMECELLKGFLAERIQAIATALGDPKADGVHSRLVRAK